MHSEFLVCCLFNDPETTEIYTYLHTLSLHDALPIYGAPAGGLALSANDMAAWLKIQLAHGALPDGKRLFSEEQAAEMWTPVTPVPITPLPAELKPAQPTQQAYALGWNVQDYRGHRIIQIGRAHV